MRKALKILKPLSINALVFLVLVEGMSVVVYFCKTGVNESNAANDVIPQGTQDCWRVWVACNSQEYESSVKPMFSTIRRIWFISMTVATIRKMDTAYLRPR